MADLLNLATSGLVAFQNAIATTGNNITNVNTEGYSRQTVTFNTRFATREGTSFVGNGVDVGSVNRINDQFATRNYRSNITLDGYLSKYYSFSEKLDSVLSGEFTSVATSIQSFSDSLQALQDNPDHIPTRQTFLGQAEVMVNRFQDIDHQLSEQFSEVNLNIETMVAKINAIAQSIADLNQQIVASTQVDSQLLDKRDNLLAELSELTTTNVTEQSDGALNVSVGAGQSLVVGVVSSRFSTTQNPADPRELSIYIDSNGTNIPVTDGLTGGALGAALAYRQEVLTPVSNAISRIALAVGDTFNQQHQLGMNLNDDLGGLFFNDINSTQAQQGRVIANSANTGTAVFSGRIDDISQVTASDYRLTVGTGPSYSLLRLSDNTTTAIGGFPVTVDGVRLNIDSGAVAVGDSFVIAPTRGAGSDMSVSIQNISQIALASPIRTQATVTNTGAGEITPGTVVDTTTTAFTTTAKTLTPPVRVEFLSSTSYQLVNTTTSAVIEGPIAYDPTTSNSLFPTPGAYDPGYRVELSGVIDTGDTFTIEYNNGGYGDSRNAQALTALQSQKVIENGKSNFQGSYGTIVADVGSKTNQVELNMEAGKVLLNQSQARLDNIRGVNLDEEAANLLSYEQAYQAASQLVSTASRLFDVLMSSMQ